MNAPILFGLGHFLVGDQSRYGLRHEVWGECDGEELFSVGVQFVDDSLQCIKLLAGFP